VNEVHTVAATVFPIVFGTLAVASLLALVVAWAIKALTGVLGMIVSLLVFGDAPRAPREAPARRRQQAPLAKRPTERRVSRSVSRRSSSSDRVSAAIRRHDLEMRRLGARWTVPDVAQPLIRAR
jgi:hypothetical protein